LVVEKVVESMLARLLCVLAVVACCHAQCYRATSNSLSFRTGPGTANPRVGNKQYLNAGETGTKTGGPVSRDGYNWIQLNVNGIQGWAADQWLVACGSGGTPPPPPTGGGSGSCAPGSSSANAGQAFTVLPVANPQIWQPYGRTSFSWSNCKQWYSAAGCMHNGIDVGTPFGTSIKAICSGAITASTDSGNGNPMSAGPKSVVQLCGNWLVLYGHMSRTNSPGWKNAGEEVGLSGNPGGYNGAGNDHLHLEVRVKNSGSTTYSNNAVDPTRLFGGLAGAMSNNGKIVCGSPGSQPDVIYGTASSCKQWCGCPGYC
jgi:murein DD-endopeptidase MepM/ murein hydrolase activator NlpD